MKNLVITKDLIGAHLKIDMTLLFTADMAIIERSTGLDLALVDKIIIIIIIIIINIGSPLISKTNGIVITTNLSIGKITIKRR